MPNGGLNAAKPGEYSAPPPIRRDEEFGAVTGTWVHVIEPAVEPSMESSTEPPFERPAGHFGPPMLPAALTSNSPAADLAHEPDNLPSFTRTTGGTITTFLPKEPPGASPKLTRPAFDDRFDHGSSPDAFTDSFSSPTTDLPAGTWPVETPLSDLPFDELATDVLPAGGFSMAELRSEPAGQPERLEAEAPFDPVEEDRYDSDAELDALLADFSAVVSPFLPTDDLPEAPPIPDVFAAPAQPVQHVQPLQPLDPSPVEQPMPTLQAPSSLPQQAKLGRPPQVEQLTEYPTPRSAKAATILNAGSQGTPAVQTMQPRPPMANIALGPSHEFDHPMDGVIGGWVRFFAVLVAVGLTAGAISYALMS